MLLYHHLSFKRRNQSNLEGKEYKQRLIRLNIREVEEYKVNKNIEKLDHPEYQLIVKFFQLKLVTIEIELQR